MTEPRRHHRPHLVAPQDLQQAGAELDPATIIATAHETAAALVRRGRAAHDPEVTRRLVELVDVLGLEEVAALWSARPARSLPGALWRLYALREWIRRQPEQASRGFAAGLRFAEVSRVVAGVAEPPGPDQVRAVADEILGGVFTGDVGVALERAAAFCRIVAAGRASEEELPAGQAAAMLTTAEDLSACARAWADGTLD